MGEKEEKRFVSVDKLDPKKKNLIYITLIVAVFALFFITFIALNTAEERCTEKQQTIYDYIESDPCMNKCLDPVSAYTNITFNYTNIGGIS